MFSTEEIKVVTMAIVAIAVFVVVPLIIVFTEHQRKMIKLLRGLNDEESNPIKALFGNTETSRLEARIDHLEREVATLKAKIPQAEEEHLHQRLG
jgi:uncharacterized protein YceH (UPF0502 family)